MASLPGPHGCVSGALLPPWVSPAPGLQASMRPRKVGTRGQLSLCDALGGLDLPGSQTREVVTLRGRDSHTGGHQSLPAMEPLP